MMKEKQGEHIPRIKTSKVIVKDFIRNTLKLNSIFYTNPYLKIKYIPQIAKNK